MGLTVHHLQVSQSERIVWLCEELGLEYDLKLYQRAPMLAPPEYASLHPIGAAPVIEDVDSHGHHIKVAESEACAEYINQVHGQGRLAIKPSEPHYADYLYWFAFVNGTFQPAISRYMALQFAGVDDDNATKKRYTNKLKQCYDFIDQRLSSSEFLGAPDRLTTADIMVVFSLTTMRKFAPWDLSSYEHTLAYLQRIKTREGYRRALEKGDPGLNIDEITGGKPPEVVDALKQGTKDWTKRN